jgi:NAD+ kinase
MATVALILHNDRLSAVRLAQEIAAWLHERGHTVQAPTADAACAGLEDDAVDPSVVGVGADVAVSLGGDGTMLRTIQLVAAHGVPVIGVNLGQLGYLTELDPAKILDALEQFFEGRYLIEERMMLHVAIESAGGTIGVTEATALNEAVLEKTLSGHTVRLDVEINGSFFTPYATDGLIVATPTGSTAYAFSARGPIIAPTHRSLLLTPVSPHMLFDRSLILDAETSLRVTVDGYRPAALTVDGRLLGELREGDSITCTAADFSARLVIFGPRDFHRILKSKFGLSDR